ncbi:hypothetical protein EV130_109139 [Rhizobium azibense]|uniref:Uncharacterized protein n=2 Tax=Rhizobium azibense TaxID=1136135 RepID=A0A4R3QMS4_9HYPH|nr:hypothetical protein EV130_109139 [Rhizobium azibense]
MAARGFASIIGVIAAVVSASGSYWFSPFGSGPTEIYRFGSRMATTALQSGGGQTCEQGGRCDALTGCIAPVPPPGSAVKVLPQDKVYERYVQQLRIFEACREIVLSKKSQSKNDVLRVNLASSSLEAEAFAEAVLRLDGDILWAPASATNSTVTKFGDEARAVFGPIPDADCANDAQTMPIEVDGNIVELKPNFTRPNHPLEFEHRDASGNVIAWTSGIEKCDKPSLAGNVAYCAPGSRLKRVVKGNVEWLTLCRKSTSNLMVSSNPYWQASNPRFALLGTVGFNRITGEIIFFDGRKDRSEFDWSRSFVPPGGHSYSDSSGRASAEALYDPTFQIQCHICHDNKSPYVINPHAAQARVGYFDGEQDLRAIAFSLGGYLPERPRTEQMPFRVIGSSYTAVHGADLARAKTVRDPTGSCTACHTLTTQITGQRFAADAVGREPWIAKPTWDKVMELQEEKKKIARIDNRRTDWALRSGAGKIHPWMVPGRGNDLSALQPPISAADWQKLSNCLWDAGEAECGYRPLYTACPAPGSGPQEDGSAPTDLSIEVIPPSSGKTERDHRVRLRWKYLNGYGGVPERDDVRFNVAVRTAAIPLTREPPSPSDYPYLNETDGNKITVLNENVEASDDTMLIKNVSYAGHSRFTDPTPSIVPRDFKLDIPAKCNRRYLVRLAPKRFCFDQNVMAYSATGYLLYADTVCD